MLEKLDATKVTHHSLTVTYCDPEIIKGFTDVRYQQFNVTLIERLFDTKELLMSLQLFRP